MSSETDLFKSNLERWRLFQPDAAALVEKTPFTTVSVGFNEDGIEENLFKEINGTKVPLYSTKSITDEIHAWVNNLDKTNFNMLFVYGIGLGHYYAGLNQWLSSTPNAYVFFLEDDLEVIRAFLSTPLAKLFLNDPKARLFYFNPGSEEETATFSHLGRVAVMEKYEKSSLTSYQTLKPQMFAEVKSQLDYYCRNVSDIINEYVQFSLGFEKNFFENVFDLPGAYSATKMFGSFKNVPAIICGAGPSLEKNIDLVGQLSDRALIFAGGTAINALNAKNINPHFGVGIDPNPFHYTRLIANKAFEIPFMYRSRILNQALKTAHGDHIYITGTAGHAIADWFEKQLGIDRQDLEEGHNVVNLSVSIAKAMGCNPIIMVGVDLAYTDNKNYSPGIKSHAIHDRRSNFFTRNQSEEVIHKNDIYGRPVRTLWKWINESLWLGKISVQNPDITILNATEGGIGFPMIPNFTLVEVADKYLTTAYDFQTIMHRSMQRSYLPETVNSEKIIELMHQLKDSLEKCFGVYDNLILAWKEHYVNLLAGEKYEENYIPPKVIELLDQLKDLHGWQALMQVYNALYFPIMYDKKQELDFNKNFKDEVTVSYNRTNFFIKSNEFLKTACRMKIYLIDETIKKYLKEQQLTPKQSVMPKTEQLKEKLAQDHAPDPNLEILEDKTYQGKVLSRSSYANKKRQGKSWFYYANGDLKNILRYNQGKLDGIQEYYYPNGNLKSVLRYSEGVLNGDQTLYHPNGKLYRELQFKNGERDGTERLWSEAGIQLLEVSYSEGIPVGIAREWYPNGNVSKEIVYNKDPKLNRTRVWNEDGVPIDMERAQKSDYFDSLTRQSTLLTSSIDNVFKKLSGVVKNIKYSDNEKKEALKETITLAEEELKKLHNLNNSMIYESGLDPANTQEQIWKTPTAQRSMELYLKDMTKKMADDLNTIQDALQLALGIIAENPTFEKSPHPKKPETEKKDDT